MNFDLQKAKKLLHNIWYFIWEDDSIESWVVNVILAFVLVKFVIYPLLGLMLSTSYPVVAVVSGSMEHNGLGFDAWWEENHEWYEENGFSLETMQDAKLKNGFSKGDIIVLRGAKPEKVKKGDVIVYSTDRYKYPIIHRVAKIAGDYTLETKGDNNPSQDPAPVSKEQVVGRAMFKIPWLGWIKIMFTSMTGG
ncbi:MAG TPA: signal peptidase I [Nanoarchaeota archaeon]|nr:signal peptidase I [Nanoarchaeota archaeon]